MRRRAVTTSIGALLMAYGLIARLVAKPGQRDAVLARLNAAARNLDQLGCRQYVVGAARARANLCHLLSARSVPESHASTE